MNRDVLWIWLSTTKGVGDATISDLWEALRAREMQMEDFFDLDEEDWANEFGLSPGIVRGLAEHKRRIEEIENLVELIHEEEVRLVSLESDHYPESLRAAVKTMRMLNARQQASAFSRADDQNASTHCETDRVRQPRDVVGWR